MSPTFLFTVSIGVFGGAVANFIGTPIPWLLGSLLATAVLSSRGTDLQKPSLWWEKWMRVTIGAALGPYVASEILNLDATLVFAVVCACISVIILSLIGTTLFQKYLAMSRTEAYLSSLPGGLSFMMALAGDEGNNRARIALVHTVRVVFVVLAVSLIAAFVDLEKVDRNFFSSFAFKLDWQLLSLAGLIVCSWWLAERSKIAGAHVTVPTVLSTAIYAFGIIDMPMPELFRTIAMLSFGIVLGCEIGKGPRHEFVRLALGSISYTTLAFCLGFVFALGLSGISDTRFLVLFLAFVPGGIVEVSLIALALGLDVGLIALAHLGRFLFIMFIGPLGLKVIQGRNSGAKKSG